MVFLVCLGAFGVLIAECILLMGDVSRGALYGGCAGLLWLMSTAVITSLSEE